MKITSRLLWQLSLSIMLLFSCVALYASSLDIEQGSPAFSPDQIKIGGSFTVSYTVYLYDLDDQRHEIAAANIKSQTYTLSTDDSAAKITSVSASGFSATGIGTDTVVLTKQGGNSDASFAVSASITYPDPGDKSTTLSGSFESAINLPLKPRLANTYCDSPSSMIPDMPVLGGAPTVPPEMRYYCGASAVPTAIVSAASGQPSDTKYTWNSPSGKLAFIVDGKQVPTFSGVGSSYATATVVAIGGSDPINPDDTVQVNYTVTSSGFNYPKYIKIRMPNAIQKVGSVIAGAVYYPPDSKAYGFGNDIPPLAEQIQWQLLDQFGVGLDTSVVQEHWTSPTQDSGNLSVYPQNGGKWDTPMASVWQTLSNGNFNSLDCLGTKYWGRRNNGTYLWTDHVPHLIGTATHNFYADYLADDAITDLNATPPKACPFSFATTWYTDHVND